MIEHSERREKELHKEFEEYLTNCSALDLIDLVGLQLLEQAWLTKRLKNLKKEYGVE